MYLPDPVAFFAVKVAAYSGVGAVVHVRATRRGNPAVRAMAFGAVRAFCGWLVGVPVLLVAIMILGELKNNAAIALLAIPRCAISAGLIQLFFLPRGGRVETMVWAVVTVIAGSAIDAFLLVRYADVDWLRISWC